MNKTLSHKVEDVKKKVVHLVEQNNKLISKNHELESEIKSLKLTLEDESRKSEELLNKIKIIKLAQNIGSAKTEEDAGVAELKRKINEYIKEIDQCLTMLNN